MAALRFGRLVQAQNAGNLTYRNLRFSPLVKEDREKMEPGMHLAEVLIADNGAFNAYPILFDDHGAVRWFTSLKSDKN